MAEYRLLAGSMSLCSQNDTGIRYPGRRHLAQWVLIERSGCLISDLAGSTLKLQKVERVGVQCSNYWN